MPRDLPFSLILYIIFSHISMKKELSSLFIKPAASKKETAVSCDLNIPLLASLNKRLGVLIFCYRHSSQHGTQIDNRKFDPFSVIS